MKHLKKFNEGGDNNCHFCNGEGKEPSCPFCGKSYLDELNKKEPSEDNDDRWMEDEDEEWGQSYNSKSSLDNDNIDTSLTQLVKNILDAAKLDINAIEESDPEFIPYIADMIQNWVNKNK